MKTKAIADYISNWLTEYSYKSNTDGYVIGISGGIDSALTSTLCAMTGKCVCCLLMPIHQNREELTRSIAHGEWLQKKFPNITVEFLDLSEAFDVLARLLPENVSNNLTLANIRARLRMTNLYAFAGAKNMLVAGTGNKIEDFGVGFFTKYGDGGVDLSPIADLSKSEVFELSKYLHIIKEIQNAEPTDGLWKDGRNDEDQLGATYKELEWAMQQHQISNKNTFDLRQKEIFDIYKMHHNANLHKMLSIPVCDIPIALKK
jgi:NAD+ synthase